jgi:hypothetical protein
MGHRPLHVAAADWQRISNELRAFNKPPKAPTKAEKVAALAVQEVEVREEIQRTVIVSGKWPFCENR